MWRDVLVATMRIICGLMTTNDLWSYDLLATMRMICGLIDSPSAQCSIRIYSPKAASQRPCQLEVTVSSYHSLAFNLAREHTVFLCSTISTTTLVCGSCIWLALNLKMQSQSWTICIRCPNRVGTFMNSSLQLLGT